MDSIQLLLTDAALPTEDKAPQENFTSHEVVETETDRGITEADNIKTKEPEPELTNEIIENGADLAIGLFDVSQKSIFGFLIRRKKDKRLVKLYGEDALDKLEKLLDEQEAHQNNKAHISILRDFTPQERGILRLAKRVEEVTAGIPLDDDEIDLIKVPLMVIMKKRGGTLPPEYALMLGLAQIAGARVANMMQI